MGVERLVKVKELLLFVAYRPDDSDKEAFAVIPSKRSGGLPQGIAVRDSGAYRLLERLESEANHMADYYIKRLDELFHDRTGGEI